MRGWAHGRTPTRSQRLELLDDALERVRERCADGERRLHPLHLNSAQHLEVLIAETAGGPQLIDECSLVRSFVEEMPHVLAIGLVRDPAQRTHAATQALP
jgi:hypothetical protein